MRQDGAVPGVVIMIVLLVVVIPVAVVMSCALIAAVLGWLLKTDVEEQNEGTEYVDLGR